MNKSDNQNIYRSQQPGYRAQTDRIIDDGSNR
jgi:hypothetical protein